MRQDRANAVDLTDVQNALAQAKACAQRHQWNDLIDPRNTGLLSSFCDQLDTTVIPPHELTQTLAFYAAAILMVPRSNDQHWQFSDQTALLMEKLAMRQLAEDRYSNLVTQLQLNALVAQIHDQRGAFALAISATGRAIQLATELNNPYTTAGAWLLRACVGRSDAKERGVRLGAFQESIKTLEQLRQQNGHLTVEQQLLLLNAEYALSRHYDRYGTWWWRARSQRRKYKALLHTLNIRLGNDEQTQRVLYFTPRVVPMFLPV